MSRDRALRHGGRWIAPLLACVVATIVGLGWGAPSWAQDEGAVEPPVADTLALPSYATSYARDHSSETWSQDLSYSIARGRTNVNLYGSVDTQNFLNLPNESTRGSISGQLNYTLIKSWQMVLRGWYDMSSSKNGPSTDDSRGNRLNIQTQYLFQPIRGMNTYLYAYTEFERKQDVNRNSRVNERDPFDSTVVDTAIATRDSSYTTSRNDAVSAEIRWPIRPWFEIHQTAFVYRNQPIISSTQRAFVNPLDGGQGSITENGQRTKNPTNSMRISADATLAHRMTKAVVTGSTSSMHQSYFDKQRLAQENSKLDNTIGTLTFDNPLLRKVYFHGEGLIGRSQNEYELNRTQTRLVHHERALAQTSYVPDSGFYGNLNFIVERARTELHPTLNGVEVDRSLNGLFNWRRSRKLVLDGNGSVSLRKNDYVNDRIDQDASTSFFTLGGGYRLMPTCSTTVHFSRSRNHTVSLDPSLSGSNLVKTNYQINVTMVYQPKRDFCLRQNYLVSAEYRIFDYVELQNSLVRARRIDTDVSDTLFSFGIVRLTHNFAFQDQGTYARFDGVNRKYSIASRSYSQTLTATAGAKIAPGVLFLATQSLLNKRDQDIPRRRGVLQNTWKMDLSLQVFRTLSDGVQIDGAVRRQGQYVEGRVDSKETTEDDWVAGVSVRKAF